MRGLNCYGLDLECLPKAWSQVMVLWRKSVNSRRRGLAGKVDHWGRGLNMLGTWSVNTQVLSLSFPLSPSPLSLILLRGRRRASILYHSLCCNVLLQHRSQNKSAQQARTKVSEARSQNKAFFF